MTCSRRHSGRTPPSAPRLERGLDRRCRIGEDRIAGMTWGAGLLCLGDRGIQCRVGLEIRNSVIADFRSASAFGRSRNP